MSNIYKGVIILSLIFILDSQYIVTVEARISDSQISTNNKFKAATLNFSSLNPINNNKIDTLFNTSQITPTGFDIKSVRITNEGNLDLQYTLIIKQVPANSLLCQNLNVKILSNWDTIYQGSLPALNVNSSIKQGGYEDLVMFIELNSHNSYLINQDCLFNLIFTSTNKSTKLSNQVILENHISSGSWD
ncbi:MAG: hypothetical protein O2871_01710 [bacterium]|jgi:hypothetical protein|nr:hypothetical protein [bacterium]